MKILHISDTHMHHDMLPLKKEELVIHSGDATNHFNPILNENEMRIFLDWYHKYPAKYKIYVAGNHDTSIEAGLINKETFKDLGIIYLENESVTIEGIKIWGSPNTPIFRNWAFMKNENKLNRIWESIPENTDIVVTHGPPKYTLDWVEELKNVYKPCGSPSLHKRMLKLQPNFCMFGHIHSNNNLKNAGTLQISGCKTMFSNGSVVTDGKFGKLTSLGNKFEIL